MTSLKVWVQFDLGAVRIDDDFADLLNRLDRERR
jgi:hypothetical protein